jgi:AraC-like DNA-binding protein
MTQQQSILSPILYGVLQRLAELGIDPHRLAEAAGINVHASSAPTHLLQAVQLRRIWHHAFERLPDPQLGLKAAPDLPVQAIGAAGMVMLHSRDLRAALHGVVRYQRLCPTGTQLSLGKFDGGLALCSRAEPGILPMHPTEVDSMHMGMLRMLSRCANTAVAPARVELPGAPGASPADYEAFFGCPVALGSAVFRMCFADAVLDRPWPQADPGMERAVRSRADAMLQTTRHTDKLVEMVQAQIAQEGYARARCEVVAAAFGMSPRTLQRRLAECRTGFRELVEATRMGAAAEMLGVPTLPHALIADRLGYAESSSFSHAVKAYFGLSPRALREEILARQGPAGRQAGAVRQDPN